MAVACTAHGSPFELITRVPGSGQVLSSKPRQRLCPDEYFDVPRWLLLFLLVLLYPVRAAVLYKRAVLAGVRSSTRSDWHPLFLGLSFDRWEAPFPLLSF